MSFLKKVIKSAKSGISFLGGGGKQKLGEVVKILGGHNYFRLQQALTTAFRSKKSNKLLVMQKQNSKNVYRQQQMAKIVAKKYYICCWGVATITKKMKKIHWSKVKGKKQSKNPPKRNNKYLQKKKKTILRKKKWMWSCWLCCLGLVLGSYPFKFKFL